MPPLVIPLSIHPQDTTMATRKEKTKKARMDISRPLLIGILHTMTPMLLSLMKIGLETLTPQQARVCLEVMEVAVSRLDDQVWTRTAHSQILRLVDSEMLPLLPLLLRVPVQLRL